MQISIAFWIKADERYKQATVFTYRSQGKRNDMVEISFTKNKFRVLVQTDMLESNANITDGQWHFIGVSWNKYATDFSIFFDGKLARRSKIAYLG